MIKVNKMDRVILNLSQEHDNDANGIQFDISEWVQKFGPGTITLTHRRKGDKIPYPVNLQVDGSVVTWIISDVDTAVKGYGTAQLMYQPEGTDILAQSAVCKTLTMKSNYEIGSTPDLYDNWMAELTALAGETKVNADHAERSADNAAASADATYEMLKTVAQDKTEIELTIAVAEHDIDAKAKGIQRYIEEEKAGLDETIETAERSIEASVNTAIQEAEAATAAKNAAEQKATEVNQYVDTAKQQAAESKRQAEAAATEATKAATSEAAAKTAAQEALRSKNTAANLVQGFDARVSSAKTDIENKGKEVIATIPEDYSALVGEVSDVKKDLSSLESALDTRALKTDLDIANREIEALKAVTQGKDWIWQESEDVAYSKDAPKGAVRMGINKIGGNSLVLNQILRSNNTYKNKTADGITIERLENNKFHITGRKTTAGSTNLSFSYQPVEVVANCKYLHIVNSTNQDVRININEYSDTSWKADRITATAMVFTTTSETKSFSYTLRVYTDAEVDCTLEVMTFKLSGTGLDDITSYDEFKAIFPNHYYPFGATIISSQTDAVEVRGKNLFPYNNSFVTNSSFLTNNGTYAFYVNLKKGDYCITWTNKEIVGGNVVIQECDKTGNVAIKTIESYNLNTYKTFTLDHDVEYIRIYVAVSKGNTEIQIEKGNSPSGYMAYGSPQIIQSNFPVQNSAGNIYDFIEVGITIPNMKAVDLGTLNWARYNFSGVYAFYAEVPFISSSGVGIKAVCKRYSKVEVVSQSLLQANEYVCGFNNYIYIRDDSFSDATSFKSAMQGVILHYEATEGGEDYTTNIKHQRVDLFDLGSVIRFSRTTSYANPFFFFNLERRMVGKNDNVLSDIYTTMPSTASGNFGDYPDKSIAFAYDANSIQVFIRNDDYTDVTAFKEAMDGKILYFALNNERITEVELPPELEAVRVESGGSVTFRNADDNYHIPIPNKETFMVKVEEAI